MGIEKRARGDVEALARGIIEEVRAAGLEIRRTRYDSHTQFEALNAGAGAHQKMSYPARRENFPRGGRLGIEPETIPETLRRRRDQ